MKILTNLTLLLKVITLILLIIGSTGYLYSLYNSYFLYNSNLSIHGYNPPIFGLKVIAYALDWTVFLTSCKIFGMYFTNLVLKKLILRWLQDVLYLFI